jgi:hypothetical protein
MQASFSLRPPLHKPRSTTNTICACHICCTISRTMVRRMQVSEFRLAIREVVNSAENGDPTILTTTVETPPPLFP